MVAPYDEPRISVNDTIIRRINPEQHVVPDDNRNCYRISSKAYSTSSGPTGGMSVDVEALIVADDIDPQQWVTTPVFTGSVAFDSNAIRALNLWIGYDPIRDAPGQPDNPYHGEVWSATGAANFTRGQKNGLARAARWYVTIPNVELI